MRPELRRRAGRRPDEPDLTNFLRAAAFAFGLVLIGRILTGQIILFGRRNRLVAHGTVLVGSGEVAIELADLLRRYPQYGLQVVGYVSDTGPAPMNRKSPSITTTPELDSSTGAVPASTSGGHM